MWAGVVVSIKISPTHSRFFSFESTMRQMLVACGDEREMRADIRNPKLN